MSNVEEILSAPHEQYSKGNVARSNIVSGRKTRFLNFKRVQKESRAAREPYRDLYKHPKIIQPKMDNWTWLTNPDLHYRMNRKKYDSYFKSGLGLVTENLFGLLGKPAGTVAKNISNAAFDIVTDWDMKRPFNSDHLVKAAMKSGKSLVIDHLKGSNKMKNDFRNWRSENLDYDYRHPNNTPIGGARDIYFSPQYREGQLNHEAMYQFFGNDGDWSPAPAPPARTRPDNLEALLLNYDTKKTGWTPKKSWKDYIYRDRPPRSRSTARLEDILRNSTVDDLVNTNVAESTGIGVGIDSDDDIFF